MVALAQDNTIFHLATDCLSEDKNSEMVTCLRLLSEVDAFLEKKEHVMPQGGVFPAWCALSHITFSINPVPLLQFFVAQNFCGI